MLILDKVNYLSKYLIEEAAAISSSAKNLDDKEVSKALALLDKCSKYKLKVIVSGVGKSGIVARKIAATFSSVGLTYDLNLQIYQNSIGEFLL